MSPSPTTVVTNNRAMLHMTSFTFRSMKRYRVEITFDLTERLIPNAEIARKIQELGFADVTVSGSGRNYAIKGTWDLHDAKVSLKEIPITIDRGKSKFSLAALLQGLGEAEELRQPKKFPQKDRQGREKRGAKNHRSFNHCHMASFTVCPGRRYRADIRLRAFQALAPTLLLRRRFAASASSM
jgi:hypothetical protein